jgi:hypothetical protein
MGDALTGAAWRHAPVSGRKLDRVVEGFSGYTVIAIDDACAPASQRYACTRASSLSRRGARRSTSNAS